MSLKSRLNSPQKFGSFAPDDSGTAIPRFPTPTVRENGTVTGVDGAAPKIGCEGGHGFWTVRYRAAVWSKVCVQIG
jgi:hypothetical protein